MNQADGEFISIQWECTEFELVKGHVDASTARDEAAHHLGIDVSDWRVEHVWCRYVPDGDEYSVRLHDAEPGARGAFRATRVYVYESKRHVATAECPLAQYLREEEE